MEPPQQGGAAAERSRPRQAFLRVGAKKVLNRRDLLAASGLEIGLLFSGFSAELWGPPTATLPPQCATCSAYLSKYGAASNTGAPSHLWRRSLAPQDSGSAQCVERITSPTTFRAAGGMPRPRCGVR